MKRVTSIMAALVLTAACGAAGAQTTVYKCRSGVYSDQNCSGRIVSTYESPVPAAPKPLLGAYRQLPGETVAEFNLRKRRSHLRETDRDECARLDKRIPFEQERALSNVEDEVDSAQAALLVSRKRFKQVGC